MTPVKKEIEELAADIDKIIEPLDYNMDLYFGGYQKEVNVDEFIKQQHRVIKYLREISKSYGNSLAKALEENQKLQAVVMLASMENQPVASYDVN